jgi:hypothetical protein
LGADGLVHLDGVAAGVDTHLAEIRAKSRLHVVTHNIRQGTAAPFAQADLRFDIVSRLEAAGH